MQNKNQTQNTLDHLAIIMDGNGRWAELQNKPRRDGHRAGVNVVREITTWCAKSSISYLTLYAFSTENWKRPKAEVDFLMRLLLNYLKKEKKTYLQNQIRFKAIGDISIFNHPLKDMIYELEEESAKGEKLTQILALNYGSRDEISRAVEKIIKNQKNLQMLDQSQINNLISQNLDTSNLPDVDLLIRTGGEMRISNFLLWQISYSELFFTPTFWPDFKVQELEKIISTFKTKTRRFGGLNS